jgi:hypothetical protein
MVSGFCGCQSIVRAALALVLLAFAMSSVPAQSLRDARSFVRPSQPTVQPAAATLPVAEAASTIPISDDLQKYITRLVIAEIPHEYENTKKWGGTKRVMSGLDWEADGLKIETRRQFREANHGSWSRYKLKLVDPENTFEVRLENLRDLGDNVAAFDLLATARLDCTGRVAEWRRGVQLVSLSGEADAHVRLKAAVEVKMTLDSKTFPPDILLQPHVTDAQLELVDFEMRRLGQARGPVAHQVGEIVEEGVQDYLAEHREKLTEKINQQLEKKRDKLRIPLSKLTTSRWGDWFGDFFGSK